MNSLLRYYQNMLLLRANPQDCPVSSALQRLLIAIYLIVAVFAGIPEWGTMVSLIHALIELGILYTFLLLLLKQRRERIHQTFNAILGITILMNLVYGVLAHFFLTSNPEEAFSNPVAPLFLGLFVWTVTVYGHIFRNALEIGLSGGVLLSFVYLVANTIIVLSVTQTLGF